jgi:GntR family transcriptional regulator
VSTGLVAIDAGGRIPPFEQVRAQIAAQIGAGYLVDGQRLPSVRGLADELGLAPGTVAKAYTLLEEAGLVRTARGAGTRVVRPAEVPSDVVDAARAVPRADGCGVAGRLARVGRGLPGCGLARLRAGPAGPAAPSLGLGDTARGRSREDCRRARVSRSASERGPGCGGAQRARAARQQCSYTYPGVPRGTRSRSRRMVIAGRSPSAQTRDQGCSVSSEYSMSITRDPYAAV